MSIASVKRTESQFGIWVVGGMEEAPTEGVWERALFFGASALGFESNCGLGDWLPQGRRNEVGVCAWNQPPWTVPGLGPSVSPCRSYTQFAESACRKVLPDVSRFPRLPMHQWDQVF